SGSWGQLRSLVYGLRFLEEVGPARARSPARLVCAPALDRGVIAALQHVGDVAAAEARRPRVVGVIEGAALARLVLRGLLVAEDARHEAHDGLGHAQGRELTAREHEVAERDLLPRQHLAHALVEALVAAAEEQQAFLARVRARQRLAEGDAVGREQHLLEG